MELRAYPEYKPSGVEWLAEIPEHWETRRLKYVSSVNDDVLNENTAPDFEMLYVDISSVDSVSGIQNKELMRFENAPSRARRQVRNGDVIISTVRTYLRAIAPIDEPEPNLTVSTGFAVIRPKNGLNSPFAAYALRAPYFVDSVVARSVGVSYPAINASDLVNLRIALPPLSEQRTIAAFLDRETARIDALISKKERQIELLKEKRSALISRAVTKGLNPKIKKKDSGIEWLGQIPEHWEVKRLRYLGYCQNGINVGSEYFGTGDPFVSYGDVFNNRELPHKVDGLVRSSAEDKMRYSVRAGDVFFTRTSETIEEIGFSSVCLSSISDAVFAGFLIRFRPSGRDLNVAFSIFFFQNFFLRAFFVKEMNLVTRASLSQDLLKQLPVLIPPLEEQAQIASSLDRETARIDSLVTKIRESIEKLREYRTALISAAITGKIDIRKEVST